MIVDSKGPRKISRETAEIMHYVSLLNAGFSLDYNDFSLTEQQAITYAFQKLKGKKEKEENKAWIKFFKGGFEAVCKTIAKKKL